MKIPINYGIRTLSKHPMMSASLMKKVVKERNIRPFQGPQDLADRVDEFDLETAARDFTFDLTNPDHSQGNSLEENSRSGIGRKLPSNKQEAQVLENGRCRLSQEMIKVLFTKGGKDKLLEQFDHGDIFVVMLHIGRCDECHRLFFDTRASFEGNQSKSV